MEVDLNADRMYGIHPERWLQDLGQSPFNGAVNGHNAAAIVPDTTSTAGGMDVEDDFMNLQSPLLKNTFDFNLAEGTQPNGMDTGIAPSITDMETQYTDQERSVPERQSLQMVTEFLNEASGTPNMASGAPNMASGTPADAYQAKQHNHLQQILQIRQQHQQQQQQGQPKIPQQDQMKLQQIKEHLERPLDHNQMEQERKLQIIFPELRQLHPHQQQQQQQQQHQHQHQQQQQQQQQPQQQQQGLAQLLQLQQRQQQQQVGAPTTFHLAGAANGGGIQGRIPGAPVGAHANVRPQVPSPDSTTQQPSSKKPGRGRGKPKQTENPTVVPVTKTASSCSVSPTRDMAYVPEYNEMRVRVNYRTISAIDHHIKSTKGCLIYFNRPMMGDLEGVEPVMLPPLPQNYDGSVTDKQYKFTNQILSVIEKGVRLQVDERGNIYATRHCRSKVFWWNTLVQSGMSEELARDDTVKVFNNEEFEEKMREFTVQESIRCLKPGVVLTFAQRWSKFDSHLNAHLVYAIVTPQKAAYLLTYLMEAKGGESLKSLDISLNSGNLMMSDASSMNSAS